MNTTVSVSLKDVPLHLLILRNQALGAQIDSIREERAALKRVIAERLAAGESEHPPVEVVDAMAPGAVIVASASPA